MARRAFALLFPCLLTGLASGCHGKPQPDEETGEPEETGDSPADDSQGGDDSDSPQDDTGDSGPVPEWTSGPALPDCAAQSGDGDLVALSGVLLLPGGPEAGVVVYSRSSGKITCAGSDCDTTGADVICTEGVVAPGLIDGHDHMQYDVLAPWQHASMYHDRYEWRSDGDYWDYRAAYDGIADDLTCEIGKWAELRQLVGGATAAVGSYDVGGCLGVGIRNLDEGEDLSGIADYDLYYSASTVTEKFDSSDGESYTADLADGTYAAVENHVAEGVDGYGRSEIDWMFSIGMEGPGEIYVHATDASTSQLARMAEKGTAIAWSPRSNLDLYGNTTAVDIARRLGVPVLIGPDWTWSGSHNLTEELRCASDLLTARGNFGEDGITDGDLVGMVTGDAAKILGVDGVLGTLEAGADADISVFTYSAEPYRAVIEAAPTDVRLVVLGGSARYGLTDLVTPLNDHADWCEEVAVCDEEGQERLICLQAADSGEDAQTVSEVEGLLSSGLAATEMPEELAYAAELLGLWLCDDTRPSCDPGEVTSGDDDGDGVLDDGDLCPAAWDPLQDDQDDDGVGDVCDPCPLVPDSDSCRMDAEDIDDDGYRTESDDCPYLYDPDQADSDGDGTGDACDRCPEVANPDDGACPASVEAISDESSPDHPAEGSAVSLSGLVVTALRADYGYYAQDTTLSEYAGIWVFDHGDAAVGLGDVVTVEGTYQEYYGLAEIYDTTTTVTGSAALPDPVEVADPCAIATSGADAERYESMLVRVSGVAVTNENPDSPDDYNELEVGGCLRIDDLLWPTDTTWIDRTVGTSYASITGILNYNYDNFKIEPREADDVAL